MIHPTRTNLLLLREKVQSITGSVDILKARRQALVHELLAISLPFLRSRDDIRKNYGGAIGEFMLSMGHEGRDAVKSLALLQQRDIGIDIIERSLWGLSYRDVIIREKPIRKPEDRGYDYRSTTPHLEECFHAFEKIVESMLEIAAYESKIKRLGDEIIKTTRRMRVLEERILPEVRREIKMISQYISEREREALYRVKVYREKHPSDYNQQHII